MSSEHDVIVIGGGPAGENLAAGVTHHGLSALLVEQELVGGECSYWGCMPSKALLRATEVLAAARRVPGAAPAITGGVDLERVWKSRDRFAAYWHDGAQVDWLAAHGIDLMRGMARIAGERRVVVTDADGDQTELEAKEAVVVATGTHAVVPPVPGLETVAAWDNRDITALADVPQRLLVLGGGAIGVEMAQAWHRLGAAEVHIVEKADRLLSGEEPLAGHALAAALDAEGVRLHLAIAAERFEPDGTQIRVHLDNGTAMTVDHVLLATGRRPNTDRLGLETVGLEPGQWLGTDDRLRVHGAPGGWMYAVGDVNGRALLTHMGKYQARVAADVIAGIDAQAWADTTAIPRVVFTDPQVASVGLTEVVAVERGIPVRVVREDFDTVAGTALVGRGIEGAAQLVIDADQRIVVGASFVGPNAAELLHAATVAIVGRVPFDRLWHAVPSFPTVSEIWLRLLEALFDRRVA